MSDSHTDHAETMSADIIRGMSEALIFADTEGIIRNWNPGAEAVFGYASSEAVGQSLDLIIPERLRKAHWDGFNNALARGATVHGRRSMVTRSLHKDGQTVYVDMSFAVVKNAAGEVTGSVAIARDATQRILEEKNNRASAAKPIA